MRLPCRLVLYKATFYCSHIATAFIMDMCAYAFFCAFHIPTILIVDMGARLALHGFHIPAVRSMLRVVFANPARAGRFSWHVFRCGNKRHRRR